MNKLNDSNNNRKTLLHNIYLARGATTFALGVVFASTTTTISPVLASTTGNTAATASSSALELSALPVWDEQATSTSVTPLNETHRVATFIGNGTMTVPDSGETINMTNNGIAFISFVPGYNETVSAHGREYVFSEDDNGTTAIMFNEIIRYDPATFEGSGLVIAVFDNNATDSLAPFNGMMVVGTHEEDPSTQTATVRLWEWESGIPIPPLVTTSMEVSPTLPIMNTTTTNIDSTDANAMGASNGEQQQQQTTSTLPPPTPLLE